MTSTPHSRLRIDVTNPTEDEIVDLAARFGIDPIAAEDIAEPTQFPKVDDFDDHLQLVIHGMHVGDGVSTFEIDAVVTATTLLTFHREEAPGIDWLIDQALTGEAMAAGGPDRMLARVAEITARRFLPVIDEFEERISGLEDLAITGHPTVVASSQALRHDAIRLRRVLAPQREVMMSLAREGHDMIGDRARQRFGDVYDHLFRLVESLDTARALLASVLDTYRSTVAESMNDVMKVLTVFSAILLPLSLLAGIYGMNFANMPELDWRWGYLGLLSVMAMTAFGLWIYFGRRGFIGGPRLSKISHGVGAGLRGLAGVGAAPIRLVASGIRSLSSTQDPDTPEPPA